MNENIDRSVWINYFDELTRRNHSRRTRLEVFGQNGAQVEECGLPFAGINLERGNGAPSIEIMLGNHDAAQPSHLTHVVENVRNITPKSALEDRKAGLDKVDAQ